jgi:hypothetical protein
MPAWSDLRGAKGLGHLLPGLTPTFSFLPLSLFLVVFIFVLSFYFNYCRQWPFVITGET